MMTEVVRCILKTLSKLVYSNQSFPGAGMCSAGLSATFDFVSCAFLQV